MKKIALSILALTLAATTWAQSLDRTRRPGPGPAPEIKLGKTESFTLPNGLRVFVVENHRLPTISCDIQLDIKPGLEKDEAGYRDMMSELLLAGTATRSKDQLNGQIDFIGANFRVTSEEISAHGLKKHENKILELMADIAMNAVISQDELDKVKKRTQSELETQQNQPDAMLANVTAALNFGPAHPYGEVTTPTTVSNITLASCTNYYKTYFRPNVAYMAIVGDVTVDEVKPLIEKYFSNWQKAEVPLTVYGHYDAPQGTRVAVAGRTAAVQSVLNVTYPVDLKPGTEDVIKARVANTILGGGSQGRLFLDLREKHGWTYGSYSSIKEDELIGSFTAFAKCRNVVTDSSVAAILDEMKRMQTEKVDETSLQNSITYMSGAFAIGLEDPARVAQYAINIERYHMPKDFYKDYLKNLSKVSADDVQAISAKYILPERANVIVVGSKDEGQKLAKFAKDGKVEYVDNYGRPAKAEETKVVPANVSADDIYKKYIAAIGGKKAIEGIKSIKVISAGSISAGGQNIAITVTEMKSAPGKFKQSVEGMGMVLQKEVLNVDKGYVQQQGGAKTPITGDALADLKDEADIQAELHADMNGVKRVVKGMESVNGSDAYVIESTSKAGKKSTEYYDVKSGLLVKKIQPQGQGVQTTEYSDYKEVPGSAGYKVAYTEKNSGDGQTVTATVQSVEVNKNIADSEFE